MLHSVYSSLHRRVQLVCKVSRCSKGFGSSGCKLIILLLERKVVEQSCSNYVTIETEGVLFQIFEVLDGFRI